jgi:hypothetical protein
VRKRPPRKGNKLVPNYENYCIEKYGFFGKDDGEDGRPTTWFKGLKDPLLSRLRRGEEDDD